MNKEMILGITGLAVTMLVTVLALGVFFDAPSRMGSVDEKRQATSEYSPIKGTTAATASTEITEPFLKASVGQTGPQTKAQSNGFQNCFLSMMSMMCKVIPGEIGASLFNGSMVCPTNFHRSG